MTIFYVYEHWRPDRDECFYVGKGMGRRANVLYGRNRRHENVQKKLARLGMCVEVRLVAEGLTEIEAFQIECERIVFWKSAGIKLANLTDGGEGGSNPSKETRALMRAAKVGRVLTDEHKQKISDASKRTNADPEVKRKIREALAISHQTPEFKAKMSASQKARVRPKEHGDRISAAKMGKKLSPEHAEKARKASLGRKQTPDEIERRRAANTGRKRSPEFCAQMKAMWTPEKRAAQALKTAERSARMNKMKKMWAEMDKDK